MHFIALIIVILSSFLWGEVSAPTKTIQPPSRTYIPLGGQKGCAVTINVWLSPSCDHCADYFTHDIPKITAMPGFCMNLHFLPGLYLLDMPVTILIWSQGPDNAYKNAEVFFKNQKEWRDRSTSKPDDPKRAEDIEEFLQEIQSDPFKVAKVRNYLVANDPFLYVKIFALRYFSIEHLEKYLPKGDTLLNSPISYALLEGLPRKEGSKDLPGPVVNFSPAFTDVNGKLLPDSKLKYGILTPSAAEDLLKSAGPIPVSSVPIPPALPPSAATVPAPSPPQAPMTTPVAPGDILKPATLGKAAKRARIDTSGAQDADDEMHRALLEELDNHHKDHETPQPPKKKQKLANDSHVLKLPSKANKQHQDSSPYDDTEEEDMEVDNNHDGHPDETTMKSKELEAVLNKALQGLGAGPEEHEDPMDHMVN